MNHSFLALDQYIDQQSHILVTYAVETDISIKEIAVSIAAESSVGTWYPIPTINKDIYREYAAKVIKVERRGDMEGIITIAFPLSLFELDNIPQVLACILGNAINMKALKNICVTNVLFPERFLQTYSGPAFGLQGIRDLLQVQKRPILGAVMKPRVGLNTREYASAAYEAWIGGIDVVTDDVLLTDQGNNQFYERIIAMLGARREAENKSNKKKVYFPNVSARISEMYARAKFVREMGGRGILIDILTVGFSGLQFIRNQNLNLILQGNRLSSGIGCFAIKPRILAQISRLIGVDAVHFSAEESNLNDKPKDKRGLKGIKSELFPAMPIVSGGIHPGLVPGIVASTGKDILLSAGGAIFGHPNGVSAGSRAMCQSLRAALDNMQLDLYAQEHQELRVALRKWGNSTKHKQNSHLHALAKSDGLYLKA